ncbi:MAG: glycosyltransferase [Bacteroidales bacterium]|nr:glycosyltransferase [Bacteroidales bacterium]
MTKDSHCCMLVKFIQQKESAHYFILYQYLGMMDLDFHLVLIGNIKEMDKYWYNHLLSNYKMKLYISHISSLPRDKLYAYYKYCDTFIMPSFYEGSPRVIKEAMYAKSLIVASDIPGNRMLDKETKSILFFNPGDSQKLNQILKILLISYQDYDINERKEMAYKLVQNFTPQKVALDRINIYNQIIEENLLINRKIIEVRQKLELMR